MLSSLFEQVSSYIRNQAGLMALKSLEGVEIHNQTELSKVYIPEKGQYLIRKNNPSKRKTQEKTS